MKRLIIIPAYNEEYSIRQVIGEVKAAEGYDCVVVNDGSTDRTLQLCRELDADVIDLSENLGIGGAMQAGYRYACENGYDCAVQIDGDGQHDPRFLEDMFAALVKEKADMVIGSRFIKKQGYQSSWLRRWGIRYLVRMVRLRTGKVITDPTSGFRMVNKRIIEIFARDYPTDYPEAESLVRILREGGKAVEIPVIMRRRTGGRSSIRLSGMIGYLLRVTLLTAAEKIRK